MIQYDWIELDLSNPSKPTITVDPPRDLFDLEENEDKQSLMVVVAFIYVDENKAEPLFVPEYAQLEVVIHVMNVYGDEEV